jgi:hypothetical protein
MAAAQTDDQEGEMIHEDRVKGVLSYALRFLLTDDWSKCQHDIAECVREQVPELRQYSDEAIVTKNTVRAFLLNPKSGSANPQDWTNW